MIIISVHNYFIYLHYTFFHRFLSCFFFVFWPRIYIYISNKVKIANQSRTSNSNRIEPNVKIYGSGKVGHSSAWFGIVRVSSFRFGHIFIESEFFFFSTRFPAEFRTELEYVFSEIRLEIKKKMKKRKNWDSSSVRNSTGNLIEKKKNSDSSWEFGFDKDVTESKRTNPNYAELFPNHKF